MIYPNSVFVFSSNFHMNNDGSCQHTIFPKHVVAKEEEEEPKKPKIIIKKCALVLENVC